MPVIAGWDDVVDTIYVVRCEGQWEWLDFANVIRTTYAELGKSGKTVDFVMSFNDYLPKGNVLHYLSIAGHQPPNIRHTVMVNQSGRFLEMLVKTADKAKGWTGPNFVKTLEEGRDYLLNQSR